MHPLCMTIAEACEFSGLSRTKIYEMAAAKILTPRKSGRRTLILTAELAAALEALPPADIRCPSIAKRSGAEAA